MPATIPKGFGRYDWLGHLKDSVPALDPGGYVSLRDPTGRVRQLFARQDDGEASRRAMRVGRLYRSAAPPDGPF